MQRDAKLVSLMGNPIFIQIILGLEGNRFNLLNHFGKYIKLLEAKKRQRVAKRMINVFRHLNVLNRSQV